MAGMIGAPTAAITPALAARIGQRGADAKIDAPGPRSVIGLYACRHVRAVLDLGHDLIRPCA
jgi:hypothetical protein